MVHDPPKGTHMAQILEKGRYSEEEDILEVLHLWLDALNQHDVPAICELYHPDAFLLATLQPMPRTTSEQICEYFVTLMQRSHLHCTLEDHLARVDGDVATVAGRYVFSFIENGEPTAIPARFSFTYRRFVEEWQIICHHSSRLD
jgi:hypothetical protein